MKAKKTIVRKSQTGQGIKRCSKCKKYKTYRAYNSDKGVPDGHARQCRACRKKAQAKSRKQYLRKVDALKAGVSCAKCNEKRTHVIDFHHNDPKTKLSSISELRVQRVSIAIIKKEIKKCTPLCATCHRDLHFRKINIKQYLKEV